ncbi:hypothetical protein EJB05_54403 [Eragrostis curvula]|uniref:Uncharacterized protein n=1 Tax=Eragrostis curvula TaxID=38414 RepID=A0A5J9SMF3_9POAL|nr:hypothetical protein EJB05_54403 [Eragrostis curvula]
MARVHKLGQLRIKLILSIIRRFARWRKYAVYRCGNTNRRGSRLLQHGGKKTSEQNKRTKSKKTLLLVAW